MGKKNKNTNVNTDVDVQDVTNEATEVVETPAEETTETVVEAPVEEPVVEALVEEKVEEVKEEVSVEEPVAEVKEDTPVVEDPAPVIEEVKEETLVTEEPAEEPAPDVTKAVPAEEGEGTDNPFDYFVQLNKEPFTDEKLALVEERLAKYDLKHFVSADGIVLVGPYLTKDGAINGRRLVIRCGLKGDIVTIPKD